MRHYLEVIITWTIIYFAARNIIKDFPAWWDIQRNNYFKERKD